MKKSILILFTTLISISTFAQNTKNDWEKLQLKGKPKELSLQEELEEPEELKTMTFNKNGFIIQEKSTSNFVLNAHTTNFTNNKNNEIVEAIIKRDEQVITHIKYTYSNGKPIEEYIIGENEGPPPTLMEMVMEKMEKIEKKDKEGNLIEVKELDSKGNPRKVVKYEYKFDNKGNWFYRKVIYLYLHRDGQSSQSEKISNRKIVYFK